MSTQRVLVSLELEFPQQLQSQVKYDRFVQKMQENPTVFNGLVNYFNIPDLHAFSETLKITRVPNISGERAQVTMEVEFPVRYDLQAKYNEFQQILNVNPEIFDLLVGMAGMPGLRVFPETLRMEEVGNYLQRG